MAAYHEYAQTTGNFDSLPQSKIKSVFDCSLYKREPWCAHQSRIVQYLHQPPTCAILSSQSPCIIYLVYSEHKEFFVMKIHNCPNCNATLDLEVNNREFAFCQYCGTKILLDDYRSTHRFVDEARIKEAELECQIRLKELEMEKEKQEAAAKAKAFKIKLSFILGIIGILMITIGYGLGNLSNNSDSSFYLLSMIGLFPLLAIGFIWTSGKQ